jgi:RHS repeat-associated protein
MTFLLFLIVDAEASGSETFSYDSNGNMISDSRFNYIYNDANQLAKITSKSDGKTIANYYYDSKGIRVKTVESGIPTYYVGDYFETKILDGNPEYSIYYFANNERVARKDPDNSLHYYHNDHLDGTNVVTNSVGQQSGKVSYYPYGTIKSRIGDDSKYLFTGQEYDAKSNLYYYKSRYYNSTIARFIMPDPLIQDYYNPQNLNRYSYVFNNPIKYTDPTGNFNVYGIGKGAIGLIGGVALVAGGLGVTGSTSGLGVAFGAAMINAGVPIACVSVAVIMESLVAPENSREADEILGITQAISQPFGLLGAFSGVIIGRSIESARTGMEVGNTIWGGATMALKPTNVGIGIEKTFLGESLIDKVSNAFQIAEWNNEWNQRAQEIRNRTDGRYGTSDIRSTKTTTSSPTSTVTSSPTSTVTSSATSTATTTTSVWDWLPRLFLTARLDLEGV